MTLINARGAAQAAMDLRHNRILWAGAEAWRTLRWRYNDPATGQARVLPAEHFGPLPG